MEQLDVKDHPMVQVNDSNASKFLVVESSPRWLSALKTAVGNFQHPTALGIPCTGFLAISI